MRLFRPLAVAAALLTAALFLPAALSGPPQGVPAKPATPAKAEAKPPLQVKVFRLARTEPGVVTATLESLLGPMDEPMKLDPTPAAGGQPFGMLGFGGGICGFMGGPTGPPLWRATVNDRTKAVVLRGSAKHLAIAADVVAVVDRAPNAPLPKTTHLQAFELKHATAADVASVVGELAFEDVLVSPAGEKLLLTVAPEADQKVIVDLVKELDVPDADR